MKLLLLAKENCAPCKNLAQWLDNEAIAYDKVDVFDRPELAGQYKIRSVPTLLMLGENNDIAYRSHGFNLGELNELKLRLSA
ncbi:MAG: thioredoxin family protein [Alphaproteobacteria bacterium]